MGPQILVHVIVWRGRNRAKYNGFLWRGCCHIWIEVFVDAVLEQEWWITDVTGFTHTKWHEVKDYISLSTPLFKTLMARYSVQARVELFVVLDRGRLLDLPYLFLPLQNPLTVQAVVILEKKIWFISDFGPQIKLAQIVFEKIRFRVICAASSVMKKKIKSESHMREKIKFGPHLVTEEWHTVVSHLICQFSFSGYSGFFP